MSNFWFSVHATGPVFLLLLVGYLLRRINVLNKGFVEATSQYAFRIALPVMLFENICSTSIAEIFDLQFLLFCVVCMCVAPLLIWAAARPFVQDGRKRGAFVQGAFRGNAAIIGVALARNLYGEQIGVVPLMLAVTLPVYNVMSTIVLMLCSGHRSGNLRQRVGHMVREILKNPIIWGAVLGSLASALRISFPEIVQSTVSSIAATATPIALLSAGAAFEFKAMRGDWKLAGVATLIKLVLQPAACMALALALGYRGTTLFAVLLMSGVPTASSSYVMAKNMGSDEQLAVGILTITTLLSSLTLTAWIFLMSSTNLL